MDDGRLMARGTDGPNGQTDDGGWGQRGGWTNKQEDGCWKRTGQWVDGWTHGQMAGLEIKVWCIRIRVPCLFNPPPHSPFPDMAQLQADSDK